MIKSFKIVQENGKAPFKLIFIDENGNEARRTHHKRVDLAFARAHLWNPNVPIVDTTENTQNETKSAELTTLSPV